MIFDFIDGHKLVPVNELPVDLVTGPEDPVPGTGVGQTSVGGVLGLPSLLEPIGLVWSARRRVMMILWPIATLSM